LKVIKIEILTKLDKAFKITPKLTGYL